MNQIHYNIRQYCKEYTQIENYDKAKADNFIGWSCHHKLEIHSDYKNSMLDLIMMNLYYNRPPEELIFIKTTEHRIMHNKVRKLSYSIKSKIGASRKGKYTSEFGKKFIEHFGFARKDDPILYGKERGYYAYHGKCSWEV